MSSYRYVSGPRAVYNDEDRRAVLHAFTSCKGRVVDRYKAAVVIWRKRHPDHTHEYAALHAVQIVLDSRFTGKLNALIKKDLTV